MSTSSKTEVSTACGKTRQFQVEVGLHQGSALSPLLFALCVDVLTEEVREEAPWSMLYADDIVLCAESREDLQAKLCENRVHGLLTLGSQEESWSYKNTR